MHERPTVGSCRRIFHAKRFATRFLLEFLIPEQFGTTSLDGMLLSVNLFLFQRSLAPSFLLSALLSIELILLCRWRHMKDPNVLVICFETLKSDLRNCVVLLSKFANIPVDESTLSLVVDQARCVTVWFLHLGGAIWDQLWVPVHPHKL